MRSAVHHYWTRVVRIGHDRSRKVTHLATRMTRVGECHPRSNTHDWTAARLKNRMSSSLSSLSSSLKRPNVNVSEAAVENTNRLEAGMLELVAQRNQRQATEAREWKILKVVVTNKSEFINIGAAFVCVLLAYQVVALRRSNTKLKESRQESLTQLQTLRSLLQQLLILEQQQQQQQTNHTPHDSWSQTTAQSCATAIRVQESQQNHANRRSNWFRSLGRSNNTTNKNKHNNTEDPHDSLASLLAPILQTSLENTIGDLAWSPEELTERTVRSLHLVAAQDAASRQQQQQQQQQQEDSQPPIMLDHIPSSSTSSSSEEALQTLLQDMTLEHDKKEPTRDVVPGSAAASASVERTQDLDGNAVVKRRKFAII